MVIQEVGFGAGLRRIFGEGKHTPQPQSSMSMSTPEPIKSVPGRFTVNGTTEDIIVEVYPDAYRCMTSQGRVSLWALTVLNFEDHMDIPECSLEFSLDFPIRVEGQLMDLQAKYQAHFPAEHYTYLWVKLTYQVRWFRTTMGLSNVPICSCIINCLWEHQNHVSIANGM